MKKKINPENGNHSEIQSALGTMSIEGFHYTDKEIEKLEQFAVLSKDNQEKEIARVAKPFTEPKG